MVDIKMLKQNYIDKELPCPYELKCNINLIIQPIKVKDWERFNDLSILQYNKNAIPDKDIIQMSYLRFLIEVYFGNVKESFEQFTDLIHIVFDTNDRIEFIKDGKNLNKVAMVLIDQNENIGCKITEREFEDIKKIILYQNIYDFSEIEVSEDMKEVAEKYIKSQMRVNRKNPTLRDKKVYIFSKKDMTMNEIDNMNYILFTGLLIMLQDCDEYLVRRIFQSQGSKDDVEHPLYERKKTIYEQAICGLDLLSDKINQGNL